MTETILCVDLDGTLIDSDTLQQAAWSFIKSQPWRALLLVGWLLQGRAYLKQQLARQVNLNIKDLPYNVVLIAWLKLEKDRGRKLVLVTATDQKIADAVAAQVGIFTEILASDGTTNLRAGAKAARLNQRYGAKNYDYAGNSRDDLIVWRSARYAIVVNASASVLQRAQKFGNVIKIF